MPIVSFLCLQSLIFDEININLYRFLLSFKQVLQRLEELRMGQDTLRGFNTQLQEVDDRYSWINDMIKARQDLVLMYMKLLNLTPKGSTDITECYPSYEEVTSFCEHLIDYLSHGHFDLYPKIIELIENASGRSLSIAHRVLPRIEKTTEFLMRFSDLYAEDLNEKKMQSLKRDLEQVGKCLEQRFKNEDRLIIGLRLVHSIMKSQ